jgi:uncharacterized ferritin-like protein (DUF455 family)
MQTFQDKVQKHIGKKLRGPYNLEARKLADFSAQEIAYLENL